MNSKSDTIDDIIFCSSSCGVNASDALGYDVPCTCGAEKLKARVEALLLRERKLGELKAANHLHRNQGADLPKRDYESDTDEYICDTYIPELEAELSRLSGEESHE